jgi:signal transduction histidine kinase
VIPYTPLPRLVRADTSLAGSGLPSYPRKGRVALVFTGLVLLAVLSAASIIASAAGRDSNGEPKRVVILNATDPYLPAFLVLDGAMRDAIKTGRAEPTELYAETLDMHRFPRAQLETELVSLLRKKYHDLDVDVVIAATPIALDFAQGNLADIWPDAAIIFHSVPPSVLSERSLDPNTIGIPVQLEFEQTLDLALKLHPAAQRIAVVAGVAESDHRYLALARPVLEQYADRMDIEYLVGLTLSETVDAVQALPANTIVLYLMMFRDSAGAPQVPRNVLERIAAVSRAPVFGVFETYLGYGIAAGSIASYADQGRRAAELVVRVLNGEDPAAIGVQQPVAAGCIADWQQLRHWKIDTGLLPADCEVRFREITVWDRYHTLIIITLTMILMQALLISALMLSRRRLRHAQDALHDENDRRREAETVAARMRGRLARFSKERSLGTLATTLAHEINQPLIAIQNYAQAARRRLQTNVEAAPKLIELVAKIEGQAERAGTITQHVRALANNDEPELQPVQLYSLLQDVIRIMESESEARGCHIAYGAAAGLTPVLANALQVQLVLVNLLHNAMHSVCASQQGEKLICVDVRELDEHEMQVSVTDQGDGVPPERVDNIFEPFYSGKSAGMGMGLAVCRDIISAHGGRIWYDPNPEGGAIFRFTLRKAG